MGVRNMVHYHRASPPLASLRRGFIVAFGMATAYIRYAAYIKLIRSTHSRFHIVRVIAPRISAFHSGSTVAISSTGHRNKMRMVPTTIPHSLVVRYASPYHHRTRFCIIRKRNWLRRRKITWRTHRACQRMSAFLLSCCVSLSPYVVYCRAYGSQVSSPGQVKA